MKHTLFYIVALLIFALAARAAEPKISDSIFVERLLAQKVSGNVPLHYARALLSRPYVAHTLEAPGEERLIINLRQLDCTTLVENVVALTICHNSHKTTFAHFKAELTRLRYRHGKLDGYTSRLHYFTDWIEDNTALGIVQETQKPDNIFSAVQTINVGYMSAHPNAYSALKAHPNFVQTIRRTEKALCGKRYRYIPKAAIRNTSALRKAISDGDIIAITTNKRGLDIAHLGFAVWRHDGLHLLNASQIHGKVVEEPMTLRKYLQQHPSHTGIRVVKLLEMKN